jgi:hypothetical protein
MAAVTPNAVNSDTVYLQQVRRGGQVLVLDVTTSGAASDTWQAPQTINPVAVAWVANTTSDACCVRLAASTKIVTFNTNTAVVNGKLLLFYGGAS